jgi:Cu2+-exporting ATPase
LGQPLSKQAWQAADSDHGSLARAELHAHVRLGADGRGVCLISVPGISCGACVARIESALSDCQGVISARANLTQRQVRAVLVDISTDPSPVFDRLAGLGFTARPVDVAARSDGESRRDGPGLLRSIAVAGFGTANIMLLSVAVWSGASSAMRDILHLTSAVIAVPVIAYAGQTFFRSAFAALKSQRLNMDVPIALGVLLTLALSLFELAQRGEHVFFDAAVALLFFLLIGRYLDQLMRERARDTVAGLAGLAPKGAMVRQPDGDLRWLALDRLTPGMTLLISPGGRIPVDAEILGGETDLDRSLVTGEAMPQAVGPGAVLEAGTLNLTGSIEVTVVRPAAASFLAEMIQMLGAAESGRSAYVRIADRAARLYAPIVHLLALATFAGWMLATGDWRSSAFIAISVLIITCPCALGLAVPVAQVVAAGRLMREGILMKDGSALERLAEIDHAVFDKTGTLTLGRPAVERVPRNERDCAAAKGLALQSRHPAARAIAASLPQPALDLTDAVEVPGFGVEGEVDGQRVRLGRAGWVSAIASGDPATTGPAFAFENQSAASFCLSETLRPDARETVSRLQSAGIPVSMLSGDDAAPVSKIAALLAIDNFRHGATPAQKMSALKELETEGHKALMVGDGLNDTAALAAAHVSMAPSSASDVGRSAADFVFLRESLGAVSLAHGVARATAVRVRQNFGLAIAYNCIAIPLAVAGLVTPLIAALAMSASSILVIGNSLRLGEGLPLARGRQAQFSAEALPA